MYYMYCMLDLSQQIITVPIGSYSILMSVIFFFQLSDEISCLLDIAFGGEGRVCGESIDRFVCVCVVGWGTFASTRARSCFMACRVALKLGVTMVIPQSLLC